MDPLKPESFNHRHRTINGIEYHYIDQSPAKASRHPPVVLVHGFPDVFRPTFKAADSMYSSGMVGDTKFRV
jgi:hypothetical protein